MDISIWTKDMSQGMENFKPLDDPNAGADTNLRFINGKKAFDAV